MKKLNYYILFNLTAALGVNSGALYAMEGANSGEWQQVNLEEGVKGLTEGNIQGIAKLIVDQVIDNNIPHLHDLLTSAEDNSELMGEMLYVLRETGLSTTGWSEEEFKQLEKFIIEMINVRHEDITAAVTRTAMTGAITTGEEIHDFYAKKGEGILEANIRRISHFIENLIWDEDCRNLLETARTKDEFFDKLVKILARKKLELVDWNDMAELARLRDDIMQALEIDRPTTAEYFQQQQFDSATTTTSSSSEEEFNQEEVTAPMIMPSSSSGSDSPIREREARMNELAKFAYLEMLNMEQLEEFEALLNTSEKQLILERVIAILAQNDRLVDDLDENDKEMLVDSFIERIISAHEQTVLDSEEIAAIDSDEFRRDRTLLGRIGQMFGTWTGFAWSSNK